MVKISVIASNPAILPASEVSSSGALPPPPPVSTSYISTLSSYASSGANIFLAPFRFFGSLVYSIYSYIAKFFSNPTKSQPNDKTKHQDLAPTSNIPKPLNPKSFDKDFEKMDNTGRSRGSELRLALKAVFEETLSYLEECMKTDNSLRRQIVQAQTSTQVYEGLSEEGKFYSLNSTSHASMLDLPDLSSMKTYATQIEIINSDTVDAGLKLKGEGLNPLVLNMANSKTPGGGVLHGAAAQEEEICRKTALYYAIAPDYNSKTQSSTGYEIPEHGCIYSPEVPVLRKKDGNRYSWLPGLGSHSLSFVSSSAYDLKVVTPGIQEYEAGTRAKIKMQIICALKHGHDSLVLGAFGCGAFANDPKTMADWYEKEIYPYRSHFKKIVFAIYMHNSAARDLGNLQAFKDKFK